MKTTLLDEIKRLITVLRRYLVLNVEYAKLTAAEKVTMLSSHLAVAVILLVVGAFMLIFIGFTIAELFKMILCPALAYLCTAGVFLLMAIVVIVARKEMIINPISRFITSILFDDNKKR